MASAVAWITIHPINSSPFNVDQVIAFLNRDDHANFRYITLGFGSKFAEGFDATPTPTASTATTTQLVCCRK